MMYIADAAAQERAKYAEIWTIPEYRINSPGLQNVERFFSVIDPKPGATLIDVGAGACQAGIEFQVRGLDVWFMDITSAAKPDEVGEERFLEQPIWSPWAGHYDYGFCCDVLEHIPPEYTMLCVDRILSNCKLSWLQISLRPDEFGKAIGEPLHLTVRSFDWWKVRLATLGNVVEARDLCDAGLFVVTR